MCSPSEFPRNYHNMFPKHQRRLPTKHHTDDANVASSRTAPTTSDRSRKSRDAAAAISCCCGCGYLLKRERTARLPACLPGRTHAQTDDDEESFADMGPSTQSHLAAACPKLPEISPVCVAFVLCTTMSYFVQSASLLSLGILKPEHRAS